MTDSDETTLLAARLLEQLRAATERQQVTARAVADLALGLNYAETRRRRDHQQLVGFLLTILPDAQKPAKPKTGERGDESSDVFKLPGGNKLELTHSTQRRIITWVLAALCLLGSHVAAYFLLPHPQPVPPTGPRQDAVSGPSLRAPRIDAPRLDPPRVP